MSLTIKHPPLRIIDHMNIEDVKYVGSTLDKVMLPDDHVVTLAGTTLSLAPKPEPHQEVTTNMVTVIKSGQDPSVTLLKVGIYKVLTFYLSVDDVKITWCKNGVLVNNKYFASVKFT